MYNDPALARLRRRSVYPDRKREIEQATTRHDKILYCRKFFRESVIFRALVEGTLDQINPELCVIEGASISNVSLRALILEYLLTGESIFFKPSNQVIESERVDLYFSDDGSIERVVYDEEYDLDPSGVFMLQNKLKISATRGEPPLFITLPWCLHVSTLLDAQVRSAELSTRLLAHIVQVAGDNTTTEFDFSDDIMIMRSHNVTDRVEFPRYQAQNFDPQIERILRMISSLAGMPIEVLFTDYTKTNFSQSKANTYALRAEVSRYRAMFDRFLKTIWPDIKITWPEIIGPDILDQAKAMMYETEARNNAE